jgi:hypothetical protein
MKQTPNQAGNTLDKHDSANKRHQKPGEIRILELQGFGIVEPLSLNSKSPAPVAPVAPG